MNVERIQSSRGKHKGHREKQPLKGEAMKPHLNELTGEIIGAAIEVHKTLGPGLLESAYRRCVCRELLLRGLSFISERKFPINYKGMKLREGYRPDIVVENRVVIECKTVTALAPVHDAQLLTYLRLGGWRAGLLINFNVVVLKQGIHRKIMGYDD
jgi:GxxExxY protein